MEILTPVLASERRSNPGPRDDALDGFVLRLARRRESGKQQHSPRKCGELRVKTGDKQNGAMDGGGFLTALMEGRVGGNSAAPPNKGVLMLQLGCYGEARAVLLWKGKGLCGENIDLENPGKGRRLGPRPAQAVAAKTALSDVDVPTMMRLLRGEGRAGNSDWRDARPAPDVRRWASSTRPSGSREDIKGQDRSSTHAPRIHDADLAAVPEEDRLQGKRFNDVEGLMRGVTAQTKLKRP